MKKLNNFTQRTLSGAAYVAVVVGSILWHPIAYGVVFLLISMLAVREYHKLMQSSPQQTAFAMAAVPWLFTALWMPNWHFGQVTEGAIYSIPLLFIYVLIVVAALLAELWLKAEDPIRNWGNMLISQLMIALPFALMSLLYFWDKYLLLAIFVLIWVNDSGAYCVGVLTAKRAKGNHKMFPRVSPKKSWEGLIGGIVLAMGVGALLGHFGWLDFICNEEIYETEMLATWVTERFNPYLVGTLFGLTVAVAGTLGDLMESLMKRTIGVKDSGTFLPGHGGVLDRFDSILLAVPATMVLMVILLLFA